MEAGLLSGGGLVAKRDERLLSVKSVALMCDVEPNTIHKWMRNGTFPQPVKMAGKNYSRWRYSDVKEWMDGLKPDVAPRAG